MAKKDVNMSISDGKTIIKVCEGDKISCASLDEKETIQLFKEVLEEYGYLIVPKW